MNEVDNNTAHNAAGMLLLTGFQVLKTIAVICLYISLFVGLYLPLLGNVIDKPVSILWWVPIGMFVGAIVLAIQSFVLDLVFALPMAGAMWLATRGRAD